jgi:hypothetical protein
MILGLTGYAGSGKDYTYLLLERLYRENGRSILRKSFADSVRAEVAQAVVDAIGIPMGRLYGYLAPEVLKTWAKPYTEAQRWILQAYGTEYRRAQDPEYWVKKTLTEAVHAEMDVELVVITDVRFENEAEAIRTAGGFVAQVMAYESDRAERLGGEIPPDHASEELAFIPDGYVWNTGDTRLDPEVVRYLRMLPNTGSGEYLFNG